MNAKNFENVVNNMYSYVCGHVFVLKKRQCKFISFYWVLAMKTNAESLFSDIISAYCDLLINLHTVNTSLCNLETVSMSNLQLFLHQSFLLDHTITYINTSRLLRYLLDIGNHIKICFWWDLKYYCNNNNIYFESYLKSYSLE